jgi:choline dehydrogenase
MPKRNPSEDAQALLDLVSTGQLSRRRFLTLASVAGLTACYSAAAAEHAVAAGENQARNQAGSKDSYDYIVVGAGAAGSVVAGELSKTGANVLVVEAGGADDAPTISNPSVWFRNVGGPLDWHLPIAPAPQLNNRKFNMALGHVLGGGSSINALVWSRGMDLDYDSWARSGATGWAFKDVLPMFKSQEDWEGGANDWRGVGGPIHLRNVRNPHPTSPALIEAARQMGMPVIHDMNGPMRPGAGYNNMNIAPDGSRVSAARAFLRPNLGRPNLTLLLNVNVTKVVFEGDRAVGVEIAEAANVRTVRATREVILSAGTIHTSQLLMLSGIGNADELKKLGIASVANLRGVGQNLQDHVLLHGVVYKYKGKMPDRPVDSNATDAKVVLASGHSSHPGDIQLVLEQLATATPDAAVRFSPPPKEGFTIAPALVQPTSRGQVRLATADWRDAPIIEANYLGTDQDLAAILRAIDAARELGRQKAFDDIREAEIIPGPNATSKQDVLDLARTAAASFGHSVGTARIGTDADAVVESSLHVRGVRGLRVADASVMPSIVAAPTHAASVMIGGRAATMIASGS